MERRILILVAFLMIATSVGCAGTPRQKYSEVNDTFISTVTVLHNSHTEGIIPDELWKSDIVPLIHAGNDLLDEYDVVTKLGVQDEQILFKLRDVLSKLRPFVIEYQRRSEN